MSTAITNSAIATPRVFALEPSKNHALANAPKFGQVIYLFQNESRPSIWDAEYEQEALLELEKNEFDSEQDYILIAGCMAANFAFATAIVREYEECKALIFDMKTKSYRERWLGFL